MINDMKQKSTTFKTEDGYTLRLIDDVWTDGDLAFNNKGGQPVDDEDQPLEGEHTSSKGVQDESRV